MTTNEPMPLARLRVLLETYGAAPARWPAAERPGAQALLAGSPAARTLAAEHAGLDTALDLVAAPAPSPALRDAVLAIRRPGHAADHSTTARAAEPGLAEMLAGAVRWLIGGPALRPAGLAAAFAAGIVVGIVTAAPAPVPLSTLRSIDVAEVTGGANEIIVSELLEDELWPIDDLFTLALR